LIRRAKRRNRPIGWRVWHYGWKAAACFAGLYVLAGLWMATSRPTVRVNYLDQINELSAAVPENQRAWPIYRDAFLAMGFKDRQAGTPAGDYLANDADPGDAKWVEKERFLTEHAAAIGQLREAATHANLGFVASTSRVDFTAKDRELFGMTLTHEEIENEKQRTLEDRWLISALLPDLQVLRDAGILLATDARRAALAGDGTTAYADIGAALGVSRHAQETPFLIGVAVADAIQRKAFVAIREIMRDKPELWTHGQLRDLAHQLAGTKVDWQRGFEGERASFYDGMQRLYTDNGSGDGRLALHVSKDLNLFQMIASVSGQPGAAGDALLANSALAMLTMPAANLVVASRKEMIDKFEQVTNLAQAKLDEPYWKQRGEPLLEEFDSAEKGPLGRFHYLFVRLLAPSYDRLLKQVTASSSDRDGVFVGLALELYHRQHKKWPESLVALAPQYLPEVSVDRITGEPLHYKIVDDRPLVYSVGLDGDDDNGRSIPKHDGVFIPWNPSDKNPENGDWVLWSMAKSK
jgi:hypothetical protein